MPACEIRQTEKYMLLTFHQTMQALSSCVLNGGLQQVRHVLNLRVIDDDTVVEDPAVTLLNQCAELGLTEKCLGMMTAAPMDTFRHHTCWFGELYFSAFVTTGLANARRAGDLADVNVVDSGCALPAGTINLVVSTNASLAQSAMVEALMVATEAKAAVLQALHVKSAKSGAIATGTGTDAMAVVSDPQGVPLRYVGKHVVAGEMLARAVIGALTKSLESSVEGNTEA